MTYLGPSENSGYLNHFGVLVLRVLLFRVSDILLGSPIFRNSYLGTHKSLFTLPP